MRTRSRAAALGVCGFWVAATGLAADGTIDNTAEAAGTDGDVPRRQLVKFNEYEGPFATLRIGGSFLYDYAAYSQEANSKEQMTLAPADKLRDFRFVIKGSFPKVAGLSYTLG